MSTDLPYRPCVGVVLTRPDGLIFAGERIDTPGAWQMPQGGIDKGEEPDQAALRELEEETGVTSSLVSIRGETKDWVRYDLPPDLLGKVWGGKYRGQKQKWFQLEFSGSDADVQIETDHPEFSRWAWMGAEEILERIVPFKRDVYRDVFEDLGLI